MTNIWAAVRWWDEWQMRILITGSLLIQWFLLLAAPMRKYTIGTSLRILIWLAYVSCDALAIYALATLFNRQAKASIPSNMGIKASSLEVLWAPILLIHLGGREEITAYNIEDNELWTRQTVTLVTQVTVATYAFYKTWPSSGDTMLLWSAILLFVIGVLSFCEKPWALRMASINRLVAVSSLAAGERKKPTRCEYLFTELKIDDKYTSWCHNKSLPPEILQRDKASPILSEGDKVEMILSDLSLLAATTDLKKRGKPEQDILAQLEPGVERNTKGWLRRAFGLIYTRANVIFTPAYLACHVLLVPSLHIVAIALFVMCHKQAYKKFNTTDVKMTYIVLSLTAVLDVFGLLISDLMYRIMSKRDIPALCETLPGHNLIASVQKRKKPLIGQLLKCAASLGYKEGFFDRDRGETYNKVAGFVVTDLLETPKIKGLDLASYRSDKQEDNWALGKLNVFPNLSDQIWRNLRGLPFDESVLLWHIATDLCFRLYPKDQLPPDESTMSIINTCTQGISNYMAHLLVFRPDMLMTGSRKHLFIEARDNMKSILGVEGNVVWENIDDAKEACGHYHLTNEAWKLAKALTEQDSDETRWMLMYHVWVGLLCYSASMCKGYLHAKSLGEGGEFLSFVWVVLALKGAKTLADKLQMPEHHEDTHEQDHIAERDLVPFFRKPDEET
ncbi:unnamed protein product [Urochloa humidicola]